LHPWKLTQTRRYRFAIRPCIRERAAHASSIRSARGQKRFLNLATRCDMFACTHIQGDRSGIRPKNTLSPAIFGNSEVMAVFAPSASRRSTAFRSRRRALGPTAFCTSPFVRSTRAY
jgi:hypothetical protein